MANRTDPSAKSIRGTDPQNLVEKILRTKIYESTYWKEQCFGLTAETLVDKAVELDHIGGAFGGNRKPTPFMCLLTKMLQIQPDKLIVVEFIRNETYKYVRVLGAFYLRLTGTDIDVYSYLEPLYKDYRKLRQRMTDGKFALTHVDVFIDQLLTTDYACDIVLPHLTKRWILESLGSLKPRRSALEDDDLDFEDEEEKDEDDDHQLTNGLDTRDHLRDVDYYHGRSPTRERGSHRYRDRETDYERGRGRGRDRDSHRHRKDDYSLKRERGCRRSHSRSPSKSRDRDRRGGRSSCRDEPKKKKEKKERKKNGDRSEHADPEIAEANRLRASLGLKPLKL